MTANLYIRQYETQKKNERIREVSAGDGDRGILPCAAGGREGHSIGSKRREAGISITRAAEVVECVTHVGDSSKYQY